VKISARNILKSKIKSIVNGPVSSEVSVELPGGDIIVSVITKTSAETLDRKEGKEAYISNQSYKCDDSNQLIF
jgi:molybdopterin-binding protein